MSTRSQIVVKGSDVKIYKHSDGYPEGVLPALVPFAHHFLTARGNDEEYMVARCLMWFGVEEDKNRIEWQQEYAAKKDSFSQSMAKRYSKPDVVGYGCGTFWHGDIEWLYVIDGEAKTVEVWRPRSAWWDNPGFENAVLVETIPLIDDTVARIDEIAKAI